MVKSIMEIIGKKRFVIEMPMSIAKILSTLLSLLPFPPILTRDQCEILTEADNVVSNNELDIKDLNSSDDGWTGIQFNFDITGTNLQQDASGVDGTYTEFIDGTKVDSVCNRVALFDGSVPHYSATPSNAKERLVLNFNYT